MKKIGLLGGMSFESTVDYYKSINEQVQKTLGGLSSAEVLLYSVNFEPIEELQRAQKWNKMAEMLSDDVRNYLMPADFIAICTNTMHKVAPQITENTGKKIISIIDATADDLKARGVKKALLLGTKFTMEDGFYQEIINKYDIEVEIPNEEDRNFIHHVIYEELCKGEFRHTSKFEFLRIIDKSKAGAAILGCTEIPLLLEKAKAKMPLINTTDLHVQAIVRSCLMGD